MDLNGTETPDPETAHSLHRTKRCPQQAQECQVGSHLSYLKRSSVNILKLPACVTLNEDTENPAR